MNESEPMPDSSSIPGLIQRIDRLWEPVCPYLAEHVGEAYGRSRGKVVDMGPFSGIAIDLKDKGIGDSFLIAAFPKGMPGFFQQEIKRRKVADGIDVIETDPSLACIRDNAIDLIVFRGAFFFPSLFSVDLPAIYRVLDTGGVAFVGGGFGKYTPQPVIDAIGEESRDLNRRIGKTAITPDHIRKAAKGGAAEGHVEVISDGGLWAVIRK